MDIFRAAVVQMDSGCSRRDNLLKITDFVEKAVAREADFILLPETADYIGRDFTENAWDIEDAIQFYGNLAQKGSVYLHCGSLTERTNGRPRNTALLFAPDGTCVGKYSKLHMFDVQIGQGPVYQESDEIEAGDALTVVKLPFGIFGSAICYDIRFGEMFRLMARKGTAVFCVSANFTMMTGKDHWEVLLRARAIENTCYVMAANQIGNKPGFAAYGNSMIIDPWGNVVARCSNREEIITADLDMNYVNQIRKQLPSLYNLRQDIYQLNGNVQVCHDVDSKEKFGDKLPNLP